MSRFRFVSQWLRDSGRRGGKPPRRPVRTRLALQALDERSLPSSTFVQTNLVSDQAGVTRVQDPNLIGAFGIALDTVHPVSQSFGFAIPANLLQRAEVLALGSGSVRQPSSIDLGNGLPTAIVFNATGSNTDFVVTGGVVTRPAAFLFANSLGQIVA